MQLQKFSAMARQHARQAQERKKGKKEKFMLFSDHDASLLRRQPGAQAQDNIRRAMTDKSAWTVLSQWACMQRAQVCN